MSWSNTFDATIHGMARAAEEAAPSLTPNFAEEEQRMAHGIALDAAVILQNAIGRSGDSIRVSLSGHSNPDFTAQDGWSKDFIIVRIERL